MVQHGLNRPDQYPTNTRRAGSHTDLGPTKDTRASEVHWKGTQGVRRSLKGTDQPHRTSSARGFIVRPTNRYCAKARDQYARQDASRDIRRDRQRSKVEIVELVPTDRQALTLFVIGPVGYHT